MISRRILAAAALLCALVIPAHAQKTRAQLNTEIGTSFPDNNFPLLLRNVTNDIVNSIMPAAPVVSGNLACFSGTTGLLQDCGSVPNPLTVGTSVIAGGTSNGLLYNNSGVLGNLATANSGVAVTSNTGIPSITNGPLGIDHGGLGATSFAANLPIIGNGSSNPIVGSRSGNTTVFATSSGALTANGCVKIDASGNFVDAGATCGANANTPYVQDFLSGAGFTAGTSTSLTLMNSPSAAALLAVSFDGVIQSHNTWSLSGQTVTFNAAIPANTQVVEAHWYAPSTTAGVGNLNAASGALNLLGINGATVTTLGQNISVGITPFLYNPVTNTAYAGGAKCDNSTNDHDAIQAAIDASPGSGGVIDIPGLCRFSAPLDFKGHPNLILRGQGGLSSGANTPSVLIYTGGSATRAMDFRDSAANTVKGLSIIATNMAFTGIIVDIGATNPGHTISSSFLFEDVTIGANFVGIPPTCLSMTEGINITIRRVFFARCGPGTHGMGTTIGQHGVVLFDNVVFANHTGPAMLECGANYTLINVTFEYDVNGHANAFQNTPSRPCTTFSSRGAWHGDVTGGTWYKMTSQGFTSTSDFMGSSDTTTTGYDITGGSGYSWTGDLFSSVGTIFKFDGTATGCRFETNTSISPVNWIGATMCLDSAAQNNTPNLSLTLPSWVPVLTPSATPGSFAYTITSTKYKRSGNSTELWFTAQVTNLSTASGFIGVLGLPVSSPVSCAVNGWNPDATVALAGSGSGASFAFFKYDGSFPVTANGQTVVLHASCPSS